MTIIIQGISFYYVKIYYVGLLVFKRSIFFFINFYELIYVLCIYLCICLCISFFPILSVLFSFFALIVNSFKIFFNIFCLGFRKWPALISQLPNFEVHARGRNWRMWKDRTFEKATIVICSFAQLPIGFIKLNYCH